MQKIRLTTVTPVYSGEKFLPELIGRLEHLRSEWQTSEAPVELVEAIFVNDASQDDSLKVLYELQETMSWLRVINLSRNYGQHQATVAGILHSSGDWVATLDEDLQHDPFLIEQLLAHAVSSAGDIVYANAEAGAHRNIFRDQSSALFKRLVALLTGNRHIGKFNSFRLVRAPIARAASSICSHGTYFDIALCWFTDRVEAVQLPLKDTRFIDSGKSGYTFRKLLSHAKRMVVSSEVKVVRLGAGIGLAALLVALLLAIRTLGIKLIDPGAIPVQGWTSLFLVSLFFGGLLALMMGVMLEYISVILLHIQGKPTFFTIDRRLDEQLRLYFEGKQS